MRRFNWSSVGRFVLGMVALLVWREMGYPQSYWDKFLSGLAVFIGTCTIFELGYEVGYEAHRTKPH